MAPSADDLPDCPDCTSRERNPNQPSEVQRVTPEQLSEWQSEVEDIRAGGVRHAVDIADLLGEYSMKDRQECSYFGHPHNNGLLIFSRCGKLLKIGSDCGSKYVIGYKRLRRNLKGVHDLQAERDLQRTEPQRLFDSLTELSARAERRLSALDALRQHVPQIYKAINTAYTYYQTGVQVPVTRFDARASAPREAYEHYELKGLKLFGRRYSPQKLAKIRQEASTFLRQGRTTDLDHENFRDFAALRRRLREHENNLREWLNETAKFWTERNLELVLIKTFDRLERVPATLRREGRSLVVLARERVIIGIDGTES